MKTLVEKVAVVTGAASGIGLAMAERFAAEGMRVVLADIEEQALATAERTVAAHGAQTLAVRTDVARAADVEALARATIARFGAVHVVCNNAGVGGDGLLTWEQSLQSWQPWRARSCARRASAGSGNGTLESVRSRRPRSR